MKENKKMRISELVYRDKPYEYKLKKPRFRRKQAESMTFEVDDVVKMKNTKYYTYVNKSLSDIYSSNRNLMLKKMYKKRIFEEVDTKQKISPCFDLVEWEKDICYSDPEDFKVNIRTTQLVSTIFDEEKWEDQVIENEEEVFKFKPFVSLYVNDPNLIFDPLEEEKKKFKKRKDSVFVDKPLKSKYNISNDKYYDFETSSKSNLGVHGVQHSVPALKLYQEFYKTSFTNEELRNFHRPSFSLPAGSFLFAGLKKNEAKNSNLIKKVSELELTDDIPFQILEYSEEIPPLIQNTGMVSLILNYFRKSNEEFEFLKEKDKFACVNLNLDEPSPFCGYGDVKIGENLLEISNNLFKAPLFRHKSSDYLCIFKDNYLHLRKIDEILLAGQTYPLDVVYSPNSRKYNIFCKNRLKNMAYRYFNDKKNTLGIKSTLIDEVFPFFSEGSKRKWMKEFCDLVRKGKENYWILKSNEPILNEEDLRKLISPENVCQYESMLATERRLLDLGILLSDENNEEVKTAPWNLTRNFVNVYNGKGLLELEGIADPTGIGEGFSFLKMKFKKGNETEDRKLFNELQSQYKNIIQKIWNKQLESLSSTKEPILEKEKEIKEEPQKEEIDKTKPYIVIKRSFMVDDEIIEEEEEIFDTRVIEMYLKLRKQNKEDKRLLKCGSCGLLGHTRTNKICQNYTEKKQTKRTKETQKRRAKTILLENLMNLVNSFFNLQYSADFHRPVNTKKFTDYLNYVKNPIDLSIIKAKVRTFKYKTFESFKNDVILLRDNCYAYNGIEHSLSKTAQLMVEMTDELYESKRDLIEEAEAVINDDTFSETVSVTDNTTLV